MQSNSNSLMAPELDSGIARAARKSTGGLGAIAKLTKEAAEECCTGRESCIKCSGCRKDLKICKCGRAKLNQCIGCGGKLMFREGIKVRWGAEIREVCYFCAKEVPASTLMDATGIGGDESLNTWALTAPDTSLSTLAPKTGAEKGPVVKPDSVSLKDQKYSWIWKR